MFLNEVNKIRFVFETLRNFLKQEFSNFYFHKINENWDSKNLILFNFSNSLYNYLFLSTTNLKLVLYFNYC